MWWNGRFTSWMCSWQICSNCAILSCQYGPKSLRNVSNTLLNLCHEELRPFWRQKGVQPKHQQGVPNKVASECVCVCVCVCVCICVYIYIYICVCVYYIFFTLLFTDTMNYCFKKKLTNTIFLNSLLCSFILYFVDYRKTVTLRCRFMEKCAYFSLQNIFYYSFFSSK